MAYSAYLAILAYLASPLLIAENVDEVLQKMPMYDKETGKDTQVSPYELLKQELERSGYVVKYRPFLFMPPFCVFLAPRNHLNRTDTPGADILPTFRTTNDKCMCVGVWVCVQQLLSL